MRFPTCRDYVVHHGGNYSTSGGTTNIGRFNFRIIEEILKAEFREYPESPTETTFGISDIVSLIIG